MSESYVRVEEPSRALPPSLVSMLQKAPVSPSSPRRHEATEGCSVVRDENMSLKSTEEDPNHIDSFTKEKSMSSFEPQRIVTNTTSTTGTGPAEDFIQTAKTEVLRDEDFFGISAPGFEDELDGAMAGMFQQEEDDPRSILLNQGGRQVLRQSRVFSDVSSASTTSKNSPSSGKNSRGCSRPSTPRNLRRRSILSMFPKSSTANPATGATRTSTWTGFIRLRTSSAASRRSAATAAANENGTFEPSNQDCSNPWWKPDSSIASASRTTTITSNQTTDTIPSNLPSRKGTNPGPAALNSSSLGRVDDSYSRLRSSNNRKSGASTSESTSYSTKKVSFSSTPVAIIADEERRTSSALNQSGIFSIRENRENRENRECGDADPTAPTSKPALDPNVIAFRSSPAYSAPASDQSIHSVVTPSTAVFCSSNFVLVKTTGMKWYRDLLVLHTNSVRMEMHDLGRMVAAMSSKPQLLSDRDVKLFYQWLKQFRECINMVFYVVLVGILPWMSTVRNMEHLQKPLELIYRDVREIWEEFEIAKLVILDPERNDFLDILEMNCSVIAGLLQNAVQFMEIHVASAIQYHLCVEDVGDIDEVVQKAIFKSRNRGSVYAPFLLRWMTANDENAWVDRIVKRKLDQTLLGVWKASYERTHLSIPKRFESKYGK
mmetsp:Transcript_1617/g.2715  ORF Transcript_1617/g.2715 Transcript_1617/m.2715 type:complete len:660 (+) Transcript_1617:1948-3927(+)